MSEIYAELYRDEKEHLGAPRPHYCKGPASGKGGDKNFQMKLVKLSALHTKQSHQLCDPQREDFWPPREAR